MQNAGGIRQRIDGLAKTIRKVIEEGTEVPAILSRILLILAEVGSPVESKEARHGKRESRLRDVFGIGQHKQFCSFVRSRCGVTITLGDRVVPNIVLASLYRRIAVALPDNDVGNVPQGWT